jgi:dTDP-4-amino-4,6-dideoxygalactose transaminase
VYEPLEPVIDILTRQGYRIDDPWDVVEAFESKTAALAGSAYAVALDSCTNALFLCLCYLGARGDITIPSRTYISVPETIIHAGCVPRFTPVEWSGAYPLDPYPVIDGAARFTAGMYTAGTYHCLSFHHRKILGIGKGGMILTDDAQAAEWFRLAGYEGRPRRLPYDAMAEPAMCGWNMYMPPEQAARGILLLEELPQRNEDCGGSWKYSDISRYRIWSRPTTTERGRNHTPFIPEVR